MESPTAVKPVSSLATGLISITVLLLVAAITAVALRVVSILRLGRKVKVHDHLCFLSLFCFIGYCIDITYGIYHGSYGLNIQDVQFSNLTAGLKAFFVSQFFWSTGVTSFRLAILLMYMGIFQRKMFFWAATLTSTVVVAYYLACVFVILFECHPISYNWNRLQPGGCVNTNAVAIFSAGFNMALDIWVVCLPLPIIWDLNMAKKRKVAITATFALGLAIAGLNLARLLITLRCNSNNFTHCILPEYMIVIGEMSSGIIVACVPTFGPVFFPKRLMNNSKTYGQSKERNIAFSSARKPLNRTAGTINGEGSFHHLGDDDEIELNGVHNVGNEIRVSRGSENRHSDNDFAPNAVLVKRELTVVETANV